MLSSNQSKRSSILLLTIFVLVSLFGLLYYQFKLKSDFPSVSKEEFNVLILPFYEFDSSKRTGLGIKIYERLIDLKKEDGLQVNTEYLNRGKEITFNESRAKEVLDSSSFDLIIYGDVISGNCQTNDKVCVNYYCKYSHIERFEIKSSTTRRVDDYKSAKVEDVISGRLQASFEEIIYYVSSFILYKKQNYQDALSIIDKIDNTVLRDPEIEDTKANLYWATHQYDKCYETAVNAGKYFLEQNDTISAFNVLSEAGSTIVQLNEYEKALSTFQDAYDLIIPNSTLSNSNKSTAIQNLATTYNQLGDTIMSLKFYNESLDSLNNWNDPNLTSNKSQIYLNIALLMMNPSNYSDKELTDSINVLITKGNIICKRLIPDSEYGDKSECLYLMGRIYIESADYISAYQDLIHAHNLLNVEYDQKRIFNLHIMYQLAISLAELKRYDNALEVIERGIQFSKETYGYNVIEDGFNQLKKEITEMNNDQ